MEALSLIDVSAEDDFLLDLASPPPHPDPPHAGGSCSAVGVGASDLVPAGGSPAAAGRVLNPSASSDQVLKRTESPKETKAKSGVNLRKSLAWDSAFFTSEGVLDTEELGIVNSTFRKAQGSRLLPGIVEEMRMSGESATSTLESENFMLESLETELFDNVRASIQRTLGKPDKAPGMTAASSKTSRDKAKAPSVTAKKGVDRMPQNKIRPPVSTSKCGIGSKQRLQVTSKSSIPAGVPLQRTAEAKPSSKPPRALPRVATMRAPTNTAATSGISDKRSSTGGVVTRQAVGKSANTSTNMQNRPGEVTKSSSTSKSRALSSAATSPLCNGPMGSMPSAKTKSPTLINKNRTAQRVNIRSSSRPDISKDMPARASRNNIPTSSHGKRASPVISPSNSLDSMSSVVSGASTASTVGKMSYTSESFSTRSSPSSPSLRKSNDQPSTVKPRTPTITEGHSSGTPSVDKLKASKDTSTHGKGVMPSGLRKPTPKIGYFDQQESKHMAAAPHEETNPPRTKAPHSLLLRAAQIEAEPFKLTEGEASMRKTSIVANTDVAKEIVPALHQNIKDGGVSAAPRMESSPPQTMASPSLLLDVWQTEVEPSKVTEHEVSMCKTSIVVDADVAKEIVPTLHQNIQANSNGSPLTAKLLIPTMFSARSTIGQQESKPMSAPREENIPSQTKVLPSQPLGIVQMEVDPSKVTEHEAYVCQAVPVVTTTVEIAKENIPALHHQIIQTIGDVSPLKENLLVSHQNFQGTAIMDASPLTMLTKKLSSISICDASPMTLLTQKLSSVSLGETTDQAS